MAAGSGEPIAGARIAFQDREETAGRSVFGASGVTSGEDGKFTYDGLADGPLTVIASHAQFAPRVMTGVAAGAGELRIELGAGGGIRGQVLRGGVPLPGLQVQVWRQDPSPANQLGGGKGARTDAEGRFEISGLAAGEYQVSFYNPRGGMQQRNQRVTVFEGQFAELIIGQEAGVRLHGCTVHFVTPALDHGPIIIQAAVPVLPGDDESSLAQRVLAQEHLIFPQALRWLANGRVRLDVEGRVSFPREDAVRALIAPCLD